MRIIRADLLEENTSDWSVPEERIEPSGYAGGQAADMLPKIS